jgi:hypothetical protein
MITNIKSVIYIVLAMLAGLSSCTEEKYSLGDIITPTDLALTAVVTGADASNPDGNGTGAVVITTSAANALTYRIDFGDGTYPLNTGGTKKLAFMDATSASSSDVSTRIQFMVPGN